MNDFRLYTKRTEAAKMTGSPRTKMSAFRLFCKSINTALRNDWNEKEREKAELSKEYNDKTIQERSLVLDEAFNTVSAGKTKLLNSIIDKWNSNEAKALEKYFMIPPRPEKIVMYDSIDKRFDTLTETEMQMNIKDSTGNYQEQAYYQSIAKKHGIDYDIQIEPETAYKNLDELTRRIKENVIAFIGDDPLDHFEMAAFFRHEDGMPIYGRINELAEYFDSIPIHVADDEPIPELMDANALKEQLLESRQLCWSNNAKALWEEAVSIGSDIQENGLTKDNVKKAETIIKVVNEMFSDGEAQ